ncbi:MAG: hypothetical protein ACOX3T_02845 [Bdellovibrionota bacterium]
MYARKFIRIGFCLLLCFSVSCAFKPKKVPGAGAIRIDSIRRHQETGLVTVKMAIDRMKYRQSLINTEVNSVRVIEIFQRRAKQEAKNYPTYRLFDVKPGATYEILGLKDGDVIVSAAGYVVQDAVQFKNYISVLEEIHDSDLKEKPNIEIIRDGIPYNFIYYFSPKED